MEWLCIPLSPAHIRHLEFDGLRLNEHEQGKSIHHRLNVRKLISYRYLAVAFLTDTRS